MEKEIICDGALEKKVEVARTNFEINENYVRINSDNNSRNHYIFIVNLPRITEH